MDLCVFSHAGNARCGGLDIANFVAAGGIPSTVTSRSLAGSGRGRATVICVDIAVAIPASIQRNHSQEKLDNSGIHFGNRIRRCIRTGRKTSEPQEAVDVLIGYPIGLDKNGAKADLASYLQNWLPKLVVVNNHEPRVACAVFPLVIEGPENVHGVKICNKTRCSRTSR